MLVGNEESDEEEKLAEKVEEPRPKRKPGLPRNVLYNISITDPETKHDYWEAMNKGKEHYIHAEFEKAHEYFETSDKIAKRVIQRNRKIRRQNKKAQKIIEPSDQTEEQQTDPFSAELDTLRTYELIAETEAKRIEEEYWTALRRGMSHFALGLATKAQECFDEADAIKELVHHLIKQNRKTIRKKRSAKKTQGKRRR